MTCDAARPNIPVTSADRKQSALLIPLLTVSFVVLVSFAHFVVFATTLIPIILAFILLPFPIPTISLRSFFRGTRNCSGEDL